MSWVGVGPGVWLGVASVWGGAVWVVAREEAGAGVALSGLWLVPSCVLALGLGECPSCVLALGLAGTGEGGRVVPVGCLCGFGSAGPEWNSLRY